MKIEEGKDSFHNFMKGLYKNIENVVKGFNAPEK